MGSMTKITICCVLVLAVLISGCRSPFVTGAYIDLQNGDPDKAKENLDKALEQNPNDPEAHFLMGKVHLMKARYPEMMASFDRSRELSKSFQTRIDEICENQWRDFYEIAADNFNEQDYDASLENLGTAVLIFPTRFETYYLIGMTYESIDSMEAAAENYQIAVEKNTGEKNLNLYYNLANTMFRLEKWEESLNYAQTVADESTSDSLRMDAVKICAVSLSNLERPSEALAIYNEIIAASPDDPNPVFDKALLHIEMDDTAMAIQDFENVVSLNANDIDALKQLGWFYLEGGTFIDYHKALDYYQKAYVLSPDQYIINRGIGIALVKLERVEEAHEYLDRAKELK